MRLVIDRHGIGSGCYFVAGPVFHKCLETGVQRQEKNGFDLYWRFRTRGDHAGLTFYFEFFGWLFEFNIHDDRHWDYEKDRFCSSDKDSSLRDEDDLE